MLGAIIEKSHCFLKKSSLLEWFHAVLFQTKQTLLCLDLLGSPFNIFFSWCYLPLACCSDHISLSNFSYSEIPDFYLIC